MTVPGAGVGGGGGKKMLNNKLRVKVYLKKASLFLTRRGEPKRARRLNQKITGMEWPSALSKENGPCVA